MNLKSIKISKYSNGFTLAEVLITLVIIGVIAAMTIPTLINNKNKQELVSGLKKANSTLQQAMITIANNNDAAVGDYSFLSEVNIIDEMVKVVNTVKKCNTTAECLGSDYETKYKKLSNSTGGLGGPSLGKGFISTNGMIYIYVAGGASHAEPHGLSEEDRANSLGWIAVDVNGEKGPNTWGRDLFFFEVISNKGILPCGYNRNSNCFTSAQGVTCTAKVLKENAMNY